MEGVALVIGINHYENYVDLSHAEADANAVANNLDDLNYKVFRLIGIGASYVSYSEAYKNLLSYIENEKPDVVILYFAGHGMMINASDCLMLQDSPDVQDNSGIPTKRESIVISDFCQEMREIGDQKTIVIADACRNNVKFNVRGPVANKDFGRNSSVPYQTFIAYSTSPGAPAYDGTNGHSKYTEALLTEMMVDYQPIEITFKNVRSKIYKKSGDQLPWENSCLVDNFCFNHGQLSAYYGRPYTADCYVYRNYTSSNVNYLFLSGMLQNKRVLIGTFVTLRTSLSKEEKFVVGRLVVSLLDGNPEQYKKILSYGILKYYTEHYGENHLLNGILYELYFDSSDEFRRDSRPSLQLLNTVYKLLSTFREFSPSIRFLHDSLKDRKISIPYVMGQEKVAVTIYVENTYITDETGKDIYSIKKIHIEGHEYVVKYNDVDTLMLNRVQFHSLLSEQLGVPLAAMRLTYSKRVGENAMIWLFEISDFEEQLTRKLISKNWNDIDCLGSLAYVDSVSNVIASTAEYDGEEIVVKGQCAADVYVEMDHEEMGTYSFPCYFTAYLTEEDGKWIIDTINEPRFDVEKYYT